ncbi:hypothetical protein MW887_007810 [Aspergillus wentii]|nr:hypothetical protein MW887_007810 [Aspergillus wentii]
MADLSDSSTLASGYSRGYPGQQSPKRLVQNYIDDTLAAALDEMTSPEGHPSITLKRRSKQASFFINPDNGALETTETENQTTYTWPGQDAHEAWRFTIAFRILAAIAEAVQTGLMISKRDIYYTDPACFGSQRVVDTVVDDIAHTIGVDRTALNVEAAAKGLVAGYYCLKTKSHDILDARLSTQDSLIPRAEYIEEIDISEIEWVLILEKEAVYRRLARSNYHTKAAVGKGIMITGKGYPDLCTRAFARLLFEKSSHLRPAPCFYALVDSDPDGMAIMSTYKYGSMAYAHENAKLNIPKLHWLGLRTSDVAAGADPLGDDALIRLTTRDRRKIVSMLNNSPILAVDGPEQEWRVELQQMLMLNLKAETEIVYDRNGGLEGWIDRKMTDLLNDNRPF